MARSSGAFVAVVALALFALVLTALAEDSEIEKVEFTNDIGELAELTEQEDASATKKKKNPKASAATATKGDRCGQRRKVSTSVYGFDPKQHRKLVKMAKTVTITSNDGLKRKLTKGHPFYLCGCDKGGTCVIYGQGPKYQNPDGTTFFANVPSSYVGIAKGKTKFNTWRGARAMKSKPKKTWRRKIASHAIDGHLIHYGGGPMWEYMYLAGGRFVAGANSPASFYVHGALKGKGFTSGLFRPGQVFVDVCHQKLKTKVMLDSERSSMKKDQGSGDAVWVYGYVDVQPRARVWTWMIESITVWGFPQKGNLA